jgi:hypothetical protein
VLGRLADNLIVNEPIGGGVTEARMDPVADVLLANATGGTSPRIAALLRSLGTPETLATGGGANTRMPTFAKVMEDSIVPETVAAPAIPDPAKATGPGALFVKFALVQTSATDFKLPKLAGIMKNYKDPNF